MADLLTCHGLLVIFASSCQQRGNADVATPCLLSRTKLTSVICITEADGSVANCLNIDVLETSYTYYEFRQENGPPLEDQPIHETYRYITYRLFCRWIWKILGKNNRKILPACVVNKIRDHFPSHEYCGFQYPI